MVLLSPYWEDGSYGMVYTISLDGEVVSTGSGTAGSWASDTTSLCLVDGCYEVSVSDAYCCNYGYGWSFMGASGDAGTGATVSVGENGCVTGCTDENADNYNADADITDNSLCEYALVQGCTDVAACNYDELAEQDNGTCEYAAEGFDCEGSCLSGTYVVYSSGSYASENSFLISDCDGNELASMSSGFLGFAGCVELTDDYQLTLTDSYGDTWNGGSLTIGDVTYDGSDLFVGAGGNVSESVSYVIGSCGVPGCTDMAACNYDSTATFDDGSCTFALDGQDCDGNCLNGGTVTSISVMETSSWGSTYSLMAYGGSWSLVDISTNESVAAASSDNETLCLVDGCYEITGLSGSGASYPFGYSVDGGEIIVPGAAGEAGGTGYISVGETGCPSGCTDPLANNFDVDAIVDNGSCDYTVLGCTDSNADNYNDLATEDDGSCTYPAPMANLFFSEYAEGSSNNKYLEIYNPSDVTVSLADYAYPSVSNAPSTVGEYEYWNTFDEGAEIAANGIYIIAHGSSDPSILALANETHSYLSNGDDGYALAYGTEDNYVILDHIGDFNGDPGSGWEVAGVSNATKDHTLVRKCAIEQGNSDWTASAGTNADDSEWIVLEQNDWSNLGMHTLECPLVVLGCTDSAADNYNDLATEDDGSCEYTVLGCTDSAADNYNDLATEDDGSCEYTTSEQMI